VLSQRCESGTELKSTTEQAGTLPASFFHVKRGKKSERSAHFLGNYKAVRAALGCPAGGQFCDTADLDAVFPGSAAVRQSRLPPIAIVERGSGLDHAIASAALVQRGIGTPKS
jgi:hypothetical protein